MPNQAIRGVIHRLKSVLEKALSWTILYNRNYIFLSKWSSEELFSAHLSLCECGVNRAIFELFYFIQVTPLFQGVSCDLLTNL